MTTLLVLPECMSAMDILNRGPGGGGGRDVDDDLPRVASIDGGMGIAISDLHRAGDVLSRHRLREMSSSTHLLESDLRCARGEFDIALGCLSKYERALAHDDDDDDDDDDNDDGTNHARATGKGGERADRRRARERRRRKADVQFEKARLYAISGRFGEALSEYEDILEWMEGETEDLIEERRGRHGGGRRLDDDDDGSAAIDDDDALPVIHGAAALNGVGVAKLLLHLREEGGRRGGDIGVDIDEIFEGLNTATEVLLESRKDALTSPAHYNLAVDLGLAASITLANSGVARCLLNNRGRDDDDDGGVDDRRRAMDLWVEGLAMLDTILVDAANSLIVIPRHKFVCMESVRARLYCNISWTLLGFPSVPTSSSPERRREGGGEGGGGALKPEKLSDEYLRDASDAAKKALDIYDELMNGSKFMRDGAVDDDGGEKLAGEDGTTGREWEEILGDSATEGRDDDGDGQGQPTTSKPPESPLSPLWSAYHRCESARALGLVARCYALAGSAVTAEGLFQSALDASSSHPFGRKVNSKNAGGPPHRGVRVETGVSLSSPNLGLIARDVRSWYAMLCDDWEKRGGDAARLRSDASKIEDEGVLKGYVRDVDGVKRSVSGLESSLWLFSPSTFKLYD
ncbi:hypothetical protein ACHAXA_005244 [Cyclostephanos tholiformis]|uniref:Uncharacterized protein n=1 Tax=Cyclostephanos tholiformis TaxID=382380 RepID=A0ABD3R062_9STRA